MVFEADDPVRQHQLRPADRLKPEQLYDRKRAEAGIALVPEKLREKGTAGREMERSQASLLRLMSYNREDAHVELGAKLGLIERA